MSSGAAVAGARRRRKPSRIRASNSTPLFGFLREPSPALFPSKNELPKLLAVLVIAVSVAVSLRYAVTVIGRPPRPFCDTNGPVSDACDPCPQNGHCFDGKLECKHGFKRYGRICIEDGQISQTARKLSEFMEHHLCKEHAQILCGGAGRIWFEKSDIMKILDEYKTKENFGLGDDAFIFAKHKAIDIIESTLESGENLEGNKQFKCPDLFAESYKPLGCCVRQWIQKNFLLIVGILVLLVSLLKYSWSMWQKHSISTRAEQLYEQVCDILEEVKSMKNEGEPWVVASWLRDHLLLPKERKNALLWKKVEELILEDSRIEQYPRLVKGESKVVLEWQVGGSLGSKSRKTRIKREVESHGQSKLQSDYPKRILNLYEMQAS